MERSVSSVLKQTFQDFELIIIDDASTDGSVDEVLKFNDPRIRLLHRDTPGSGGYAARNLGIKEAMAEWVAFLDADDEWYPEHLSNYYRLINQYPSVTVLGCGYKYRDPDYQLMSNFVDSFHRKNRAKGVHQLSFEDYLNAEVTGVRPLHTSTVCIKRKTLLAVGAFPDGKTKRGGDVDTWFRCIEMAGFMLWSSHIGSIYYRDSVNMVTRTQLLDAMCERDSVRKVLPKYTGNVLKLLKTFSNQRTIDAWRRNTHVTAKTGERNIALKGDLYIECNILKTYFWIAFSFLPEKAYIILEDIYRNSKGLKLIKSMLR